MRVAEGLMIKFSKPLTADGIKYSSGKRRAYILELGEGSRADMALVVFNSRLVNTCNKGITMMPYKGFKYCRWVKKELIEKNCEVILT